MHIYTLDGNEYPSVTTVLHMISTNDELMKWANIMGFKRKDITKIQNDVTGFGTMVHSHLQHIVDKDTSAELIKPKDGIDAYRLDHAIKNFKNTFDNVNYTTLYSEKTIISPELGYAGTLDWYFKSNIHILADFKTSKKIRDHMFLQLGGYYNLLKSIGEDADGAMIIIVNENECKPYPVAKNMLIQYANAFNLLFYFYKAYQNLIVTKKIDYAIFERLKQPHK